MKESEIEVRRADPTLLLCFALFLTDLSHIVLFYSDLSRLFQTRAQVLLLVLLLANKLRLNKGINSISIRMDQTLDGKSFLFFLR